VKIVYMTIQEYRQLFYSLWICSFKTERSFIRFQVSTFWITANQVYKQEGKQRGEGRLRVGTNVATFNMNLETVVW